MLTNRKAHPDGCAFFFETVDFFRLGTYTINKKEDVVLTIREVTYLAILVRILTAVLFGGLLGLERGMKHRPAGMRTYMLVCVGSCLIMLTNQYLFQTTGTGDPMRLGAQVVSGIGFLGAGTIIVTKHNQIKGLTTAAGLWSAAGVGLALGVGFYEAAVVAGVAIFTVLTLLQRLDNKMRSKTKYLDLYIEFSQDVSLGALIQNLREIGLEVSDLQNEPASAFDSNSRGLVVSLSAKKRTNHLLLMEQIQKIPGILHLEEL